MVFDPTTYGTLVYWDECTNSAKQLNSGGTPAANNTAIMTVTDSGPNAINLTQSTAGYRPTNFTNQINGLQISRFDGARGFGLTNAQSSLISKNRSGLTIAVAFKPSSLAANQRLMQLYGPSALRAQIFLMTNGNWGVSVRPQDAGTQYDGYTSGVTQSTGNLYISVFKLDFAGNAAKAWVNNTQVLSSSNINSSGNSSNTNASGDGDSNQFFFNYYGSGGLRGDLLDFLIWNGALSDANCGNIYTALNSKYTETAGFSGTAAQTKAAATQAASGAETFTGTGSQTKAAATQDAAGKAFGGAAAQTKAAATQAASGKETFSGAAVQQKAAASQSASGAETFTGTGAQQKAPASQSATGADFGGTAAQQGGQASQSAAGAETLTGAGSQTKAPAEQAGSGTVVTPITGTAAQTKAAAEQAAVGKAFGGTAEQQAAAAQQSAAGAETFSGAASQTKSAQEQSAGGLETFSGQAAQQKAPAEQAASGTNVLNLFTGTITQTLGPRDLDGEIVITMRGPAILKRAGNQWLVVEL